MDESSEITKRKNAVREITGITQTIVCNTETRVIIALIVFTSRYQLCSGQNIKIFRILAKESVSFLFPSLGRGLILPAQFDARREPASLSELTGERRKFVN